jgi:hypothetical protein
MSDPASRFLVGTLEQQRRIGQILDDPDAIDVRRAVAVSQLVLENIELIPDAATLHTLAELYRRPGEEISKRHIDLARWHYVERVQKAAERHAKTQALAHRQLSVTKILLQAAIPIMKGLAGRVAHLAKKYVPNEMLGDFMAELREAMGASLGELESAAREADTKRP